MEWKSRFRRLYGAGAAQGTASLQRLGPRVGLALTAGLLWGIAALGLAESFGLRGVPVALALLIPPAVLIATNLTLRLERLSRANQHDQLDLQSLLGLYASLRPPASLPPMGGAALSPDTCLAYVELIRQRCPQTVVELGSGTSTVLAAYQLAANGGGRVIALDHEELWGLRTEANLKAHGLTEWGEIRIAPLEPVLVGDKMIEWYATAALEDAPSIDVLLIDGPPDIYGLGVSRRPGLSLLAERLAPDGAILVDDCVIPAWHRWVTGWAAAHGFSVEPLNMNRKGALVLRRSA